MPSTSRISVEAMLLVRARLEEMPEGVAGNAFNMGGGPGNAVSLLELVEQIAACVGERPEVEFGPGAPATSATTCRTPASSRGPPAGGPESGSAKAFAGWPNGSARGRGEGPSIANPTGLAATSEQGTP